MMVWWPALARSISSAASSAAVQSIKEWSHPVETRKEKAQVASISAHNDVKMGELVADAFERVGDDGVITVEAATREGDLPRGEHQRRLPPSGPTEKLAPTQLLRRPGRDECDAQLAILAARECAVATRVGAGHGTCW